MDLNKESNKLGSPFSVQSASDGKNKARLNKRNPRGETSLHIAARKGDATACERLIEEGIDLNQVDHAGWTTLHEACARSFYRIVELLIRNGADVNVKSFDEGETPLHDAVQTGNSKLVWLLLRAGADKTIENKNGKLASDMNFKGSAEITWLLSQTSTPTEFPFQSAPQNQEIPTREVVVKESVSKIVEPMETEQAPENANLIPEDAQTERVESSDGESNSDENEEGESGEEFSINSRVSSIYSDTRNRGRKRTRVGVGNVIPRKLFTSTTFPPSTSGTHDVYEFRSSPESDEDNISLQKPIFGESRAHTSSEPLDTNEPYPKRHKHSKEPKTTSNQGSDMVQYDESDSSNHPIEDNSTKKVPPLRILLPKTPSEDEPALEAIESTRKAIRSIKAVTSEKKNSDKIEGPNNTNTQRMTRSKVKQTGANLDEPKWSNKRKGWRRSSNASAVSAAAASATRNTANNSHQPTPELGDNESSNNTEHEKTVSPSPAPMDEASRSSAGGESDKVVETTSSNDTTSLVLSLFSKTPYEGFYELRGMTQNRWLKILNDDATEDEAAIKQMEQFQLTTSYALADKPPNISSELNIQRSWPEPLIKLAEDQTKHRTELALAHKAERQRLLLFAEREYLRNMKRTLNISTRTVPAMRILRDAEIYNPLVIEIPEEQPSSAPSNSKQQLSERLKHLASSIKNRHIAEAHSLLAEQKYDWEKTFRRCCEIGSNDKVDTNFIPLVPFEEINFSFL